ncbi:hypothetical protein G6F61_014840 [Rhizopus arrhizus]|nr:hypothetical protein G6F61_014840 [Rhizopus arrhizus]
MAAGPAARDQPRCAGQWHHLRSGGVRATTGTAAPALHGAGHPHPAAQRAGARAFAGAPAAAAGRRSLAAARLRRWPGYRCRRS